MKKNKFDGWKTVYGFTFRQACGKGFKIVTAIFAILIIAAMILVNVLVAKPGKDKEPSSIEHVYVLDESGLGQTDYKSMLPSVKEKIFDAVTFVQIDGKTREEVIAMAKDKSLKTIAVIITKQDDKYQLEAAIPDGSEISKDEAGDLVEAMVSCFESSKMMQAGLSVEQLVTVMKPVQTSVVEVGEETSLAVQLVKMLAPMLFGLLLYMMLILHGQTISKSVSSEKTSKLMETLLTSIHPYALITGKILAIASMAILQFIIWIASVVGGFFIGNAVAHSMYPEYQSTIVTVIDFLKDNIGESAFSLPAVILAIVVFCIGFLFYCVIAGLAGCMVAKPEDVASMQGLFQFPVIISWLICYLAPVMENEGILKVARFIPFTAPFCVPIDLITGAVGIIPGIISLVILLAASLLLIMLAARIYKGLVLYTGQKISLKVIKNVIRAKN